MLRRLKPTRIELKKSDLEEFEQRLRGDAVAGSGTPSFDAKEPLPSDTAQRQAAIHKRIGYEPQTVPSDGATNIRY